MKVTLLIENNSLFGRYLNAEHGFSAWIEDSAVKILYDCGFSDKFIYNAEALGIDLLTADYVIVSHGHRDHSWGLKYLLKYYRDKAMARKPIFLYTIEDLFYKKFNFIKSRTAGFDVSREMLDEFFEVRSSAEPVWLTDNLCFMGVTRTSNDYERKVPQVQKKLKNGGWEEDLVDEDTQLAYRHADGEHVSIVAGCAHYGICNIMEYAKKVTGASKIHTYLGGSHLRIDEVPQSQVDKTCDYVKQQHMKRFYICHDTDLHCKLALWNCTPSLEAGVGLVVECE